MSAFKTQLDKYSQNAVCSKGQRQYSKREQAEHALLKRHDLSKEDWTSLLLQITALAIGTSRTYQMSLMESEYNSSYADEFGLSLGEIAQFQGEWYVRPQRCHTTNSPCQARCRTNLPNGELDVYGTWCLRCRLGR